MLIILSDYSNQRIPVSELFACWVFCMLLLSVDFFKLLFKKDLSGIPSEHQTVWIQFRPDTLSSLILVQTVSEGYQQATKAATWKGKINQSLTSTK